MKEKILDLIKENIEKIDVNIEQESLYKDFFSLSELLGLGILYDIVVDSSLLSKYDKYDKNLCPRNKEQLIADLENLYKKS